MNTVENIEAKGEIAQKEQFLPLPKCFQKSSAAEASEKTAVGGKGYVQMDGSKLHKIKELNRMKVYYLDPVDLRPYGVDDL